MGRLRVYCSGRAEGLNCSNRGTFLDIYESQIEWYLRHFIIPNDYQEKILDAHRKLESYYDDTNKRREILENSITRLKELYKWGHITKEEYQQQLTLQFACFISICYLSPRIENYETHA